MSETESKAALWHRKKEFRAIWGNPDSLRPLGRNNMSQLLLHMLSRVLANCPQLMLSCISPHTGKKGNCKTNQREGCPRPFSLLNLPSLEVALQRAYSPHNLLSVFSCSFTQTEASKTSGRFYSGYLLSQPKSSGKI